MKPLVVNSSMTNMEGVFYPTGHVFVLFQDEEGVRQSAAALQLQHHHGALAYASPESIHKDILRTLDNTDSVLPSVGAESDIARRLGDMASSGHHGLLIEITSKDAIENVLDNLTQYGAKAAFYYRTFLIEEVISPPSEPTPSAAVVGTLASGSNPGKT